MFFLTESLGSVAVNEVSAVEQHWTVTKEGRAFTEFGQQSTRGH